MYYKKLYFFDLGLYFSNKMNNAKIKTPEFIKENKVLIKKDKKWELNYHNGYPNIFYDKFENKYRCYYAVTIDAPHRKVTSFCYSESLDGINWEKINVNNVAYDGSYENNIIGYGLHGSSVFLDENEINENKRYKMFTRIDFGMEQIGIYVGYSKDGLKEPLAKSL